ncbi:hypothetical protein [Acinetobacter calcoaceticus]|uniref:hypothetical protein n=1 Tax=Acinetobacter calcoaceticus TaxID=471 RepID=UPI00192B3034|nr:hypothetical protein [Acinetobacter calcoaceticus]
MNIFSIVYFSRLSFNNIKSDCDFIEFLQNLEDIVKLYKKSKSIKFEISSDFLDYSEKGIVSLSDLILSLIDNDSIKLGYYLSEIEKIFTSSKSYNNTYGIKNTIMSWDGNSLCTHYPFIIAKEEKWPNLEEVIHTYAYSDTLHLNCDYIIRNHSNASNFIDLCKLCFDFLIFHEDILTSLQTIQKGTYVNYIETLLHCLNVLNQAYHLISTSPNQNQSDLVTIMNLSAQLGKHLQCTRQRKNRIIKIFPFPLELGKTGGEAVNCEYHLKINNYDNGQPIERGTGNLVRIYFALKSYEQLERKQIKIAHIGKHL